MTSMVPLCVSRADGVSDGRRRAALGSRRSALSLAVATAASREVDFVNSVQFSNHTGYDGGWTGEVLGGAQLEALAAGLARNALPREGYSYVLTGCVRRRRRQSNALETNSGRAHRDTRK
jgi:pyridoxine kinase